jgi:hypothetical protein
VAKVYEELGATKEVEDCRNLLRLIEDKLNASVALGRPSFNCELP